MAGMQCKWNVKVRNVHVYKYLQVCGTQGTEEKVRRVHGRKRCMRRVRWWAQKAKSKRCVHDRWWQKVGARERKEGKAKHRKKRGW